MSRSHALLSAIGLAFAASLSAQARSPDIPAYENRLDSLKHAAARAESNLRAFDDSVSREVRRLDTVKAGPIVVLAERGLVPFATEVARATHDSVAPVLGRTLDRLSGRAFVLRRRTVQSWEKRRDEAEGVTLSFRSPSSRGEGLLIRESSRGEVRLVRGFERAAEISAELQDRTFRVVYFDDDARFSAWMARQLPHGNVTNAIWMRHRMQLVSSPAAVSRQCYEGDLRACAIVLDLADLSDPALQLYDAAGRRRVVERALDNARREDSGATEGCLAGSDSACVSLLRRFGARIPLPFVAAHRVSLAKLAISVGGDGAEQRMLAPGSPAERLAAAAGIPIDSLISRWQQRVRHTQEPSRDLTFEIGFASIAWILGLAALSMRSSRWR